jgi:membrane protein YdbS with pleckstrin-like domain
MMAFGTKGGGNRREPTWRIPVGILGLMVALGVYGMLIASYIAPLIANWPTLAQAPVYLVLGVVWLLPLRRFLIWMETGRWSPPPQI